MKKVPFHGGRACYACDAKPIGLRDRRPEGGDLEPACRRHADPRIKVYEACRYCDGPIRAGSLHIDGEFVHAACEADAARDFPRRAPSMRVAKG